MRETRRFRWVRRIVLTVLCLFVGFPLYVMVTTSVQPFKDVGAPFRWIPRHVTLAPYGNVWSAIPLGHYLTNSAIVAGSAAVLAVLIATPAGYAAARFPFRGRGVFRTGVIGSQLLPGLFFLVPMFLLYAQFDRTTGITLIGTYFGLILIDLALGVPFAVWLLAGWFASQPKDAEEAAALDGASGFAVFARIAVPGATPAIAATLVYVFALSWSEVLFAAILTDQHTEPVAVGLPALTGSPIPQWNDLMAASIISAVPVVLAWLVASPVLKRVLGRT